jgi:hypothetical protein
MSACLSLLGNESYLVNTSQLNPQLLNYLLKSTHFYYVVFPFP